MLQPDTGTFRRIAKAASYAVSTSCSLENIEQLPDITSKSDFLVS